MVIRNQVQETAGACNDYRIYIFMELLIIILILPVLKNTGSVSYSAVYLQNIF